MSLAENLRAARAAAGLSQQQVAGVVGIQRTSLSDIENGGRAVSTLELKAFAALYSTSADALLGSEGTDAPSVQAPGVLLQRLEKVTSDLHGYLEQRAQELAQPRIELAEEAAAARVHQAEDQLRHRNDVCAELRRQLTAALRGQARARHAAGLRHEKEYCEHCKTETVVTLRPPIEAQPGGPS